MKYSVHLTNKFKVALCLDAYKSVSLKLGENYIGCLNDVIFSRS